MGIQEAYNTSANNAAARTKPAPPPPAKIPVTDRPFDIIDESNFASYINSGIGLNFIKYLDERVKTEKNANIKNKINYILDYLRQNKMPSSHKDILFQLFNNFHIEHYKYNTYV